MENITVGFVGLGSMGVGIAANIRKAGYRLCAYDIDEERIELARQMDVETVASLHQLIVQSDVVCTSLPDPEIFVEVADSHFIPNCEEGMVFIDFGTSQPEDTKRIQRTMVERGCDLLDAPVSGGPDGAREGSLRIFAGGDEDTFQRLHPILRSAGDPRHIVYCGESGMGQVVKGVNQLLMGLTEAAVLEAFSYGINSGVDVKVLDRAVGGSAGYRELFTRTARKVTDGSAHHIGVKHGQLAHFLSHIKKAGYPLPLAEALCAFLNDVEPTIVEANRSSPSFWGEITRGGHHE